MSIKISLKTFLENNSDLFGRAKLVEFQIITHAGNAWKRVNPSVLHQTYIGKKKNWQYVLSRKQPPARLVKTRQKKTQKSSGNANYIQISPQSRSSNPQNVVRALHK